MPKINEAVKAWEMRVAGRVGKAVQKRRKAKGWTGVELAERTAELGYPITRVAISKIERNTREGKLNVAELLVLAEALGIAPVLLLAPDFPDGEVETRPGRSVDSRQAVGWFSGREAELIEADALAAEGDRRLSDMREREAAPTWHPNTARCSGPTESTSRLRCRHCGPTSNAGKTSYGVSSTVKGLLMSRRQLPPQIKKIEVTDRKTGQNCCAVSTYGRCRDQSRDG